ncbi:MAG: shikimate dehydrogenase [Defluviicoccus sp.]|nr:MAG: shikimate dehydrogenase [Defluviicoccus sp.]
MNSDSYAVPERPLLSGSARLAGVMGWPISHSMSPRLHGLWLARYRIDGAYIPLPVRPDDVSIVLAALPKMGFRGVNVTVPLKEHVLPLVHQATSAARRIGAVNTVIVDDNGLLIGSNTDAFGFVESLRDTVPGWRADRGPAVVLGAGGAARAIVYALLAEGVPEIRLINRTLERAHTLAADLGGAIRALPWSERTNALAGAALLVNSTTLGMAHQPPLEFDLSALPETAVVCDIVYTPLVTPLLAAAAARGNPVVDGLGMLLHQARPGFAAWFGRMPDVTPELRQALLQTIAPT